MITDTINEDVRDKIRQMQGEIERLREQLGKATAALEALDLLLDFSDEDVGKIWTFDDATDIQAAFKLAHSALSDEVGN